jgi:hypothetical protein
MERQVFLRPAEIMAWALPFHPEPAEDSTLPADWDSQEWANLQEQEPGLSD